VMGRWKRDGQGGIWVRDRCVRVIAGRVGGRDGKRRARVAGGGVSGHRNRIRAVSNVFSGVLEAFSGSRNGFLVLVGQ